MATLAALTVSPTLSRASPAAGQIVGFWDMDDIAYHLRTSKSTVTGGCL